MGFRNLKEKLENKVENEKRLTIMHKYDVFSGILWQKSNDFMDKSDLLRSFCWNRNFNVFLCSDHSLLISLMKKK